MTCCGSVVMDLMATVDLWCRTLLIPRHLRRPVARYGGGLGEGPELEQQHRVGER